MEGFLAILPYALLFLLCPLMMLFMHRGGAHEGGHAEHHTGHPAEPSRPISAAKNEVKA